MVLFYHIKGAFSVVSKLFSAIPAELAVLRKRCFGGRADATQGFPAVGAILTARRVSGSAYAGKLFALQSLLYCGGKILNAGAQLLSHLIPYRNRFIFDISRDFLPECKDRDRYADSKQRKAAEQAPELCRHSIAGKRGKEINKTNGAKSYSAQNQ